jgi:hypothetical protein
MCLHGSPYLSLVYPLYIQEREKVNAFAKTQKKMVKAPSMAERFLALCW